MARKATVVLEDDLDGGQADETVQFGFDGTHYQIDLSKKNARTFRKVIAPYIEHGRKIGRLGQPRRGVRTAASRKRSADIRAWALERGISVSNRGRIPTEIGARYEAAKRVG